MGSVGVHSARRLGIVGTCWLVVVGLWLALATSARAAGPDQDGSWGPLLKLGVTATHQILMHNGKVLVWRAGSEALVWDPATGNLTDAPEPFPMVDANFHCGAHVALADGRILVLGGGDSPHHGNAAAALFDPATLKWTRLPDMNAQRWYPSATALSDGRVLVAGGEDGNGVDVDSVEIYDPKTGQWTLIPGADHNQDLYSRNYLLPDGRIYEAAPRAATWFLNISTGNWSSGPSGLWRTNSYSESGAMYLPGKIIRSGGTDPGAASTPDVAQARTGIVDMTAGNPKWQEVDPMAFRRRRHNMVIMADGQVVAIGGTQQGNDVDQSVYEAEIWNPDTKQWRTGAAMTTPRSYHSAAVLLPDGRILSAGGEPSDFTSNGSAITETAQLYSPPYMFKDRPVISAAPATAGYGGSISINTANSASIDSVALIRPGSSTHAIDFEQRYVPLSFTKGPGQLTATAPPNGNVTPPGFYMLVIKDAGGVPSVAKWIQIGSGLESGGVPPAPPPAPPAPPAPPPPGRQPPPSSGPPSTGGSSSTGTEPSDGGGQPSGTGTATGEAAGRAAVGRGGTGRITALRAPRRITLRSARRRLALSMRIEAWGDRRSRELRVRLYRLAGARRKIVLVLVRSAPAAGPRNVALPAPTLRRSLRAGRYEVDVTVGEPGGTRSPVARRRITIVR